MSDAREIVQPRWKRRATEIAEAIGGGGVQSVSLDENTITLLSQAIADAIDLKVLDINIRKYDDNFVSSSGIPIRTGVGVASGQFMPLRVVTSSGDKVDVNIKQFNDVELDTRGLPVQAGRTTNTNTLVPLVVNCPTTNNFPGGGGGGGLNITDTTTAFKNALYGVGVTAANQNMIHSVEVGTSNAISTTLRNPNFPLAVDITRIRGTNVASSPAGVGAHFPVATYTSALNVSGAAVTFPSTMAVTLPVDSNTGVTIPLATTETTPLTTLPVTLPVDANNVTIPLATTETLPVTTTTVTGSVTVQPALDANNVAIPLSVTETAPVTNVAVQSALDANNVAIPLFTTETTPLSTLPVTLPVDANNVTIPLLVTETAPVTTVAVNNHPTTTEVTLPLDANGLAIPMKVTETHPVYGTNVQEVKIVGDETYGIIMSQNYYETLVSPYGSDADYNSFGFGLGTFTGNNRKQGNPSSNQYTSGWTIRVNGVDIHNQDITYGLRGSSLPQLTQSNANQTPAQWYAWLKLVYPLFIPADSQATVHKYHGLKVTLSSLANVWVLEPEHVQEVGSDIRGQITAYYYPHYWNVRTTNGANLTKVTIWNGTRSTANSTLHQHSSTNTWVECDPGNPKIWWHL